MATRKKILIGCGGCLGLLVGGMLLLFVVVGVLIEAQVLPDYKIVQGSKLTDSQRQTLVDLDVLNPDEKVIYFYSTGLFSITGDGNFFTEDRVVSYEDFEGKFVADSATYPEILSIEVETEGGMFEDGLVWVQTRDDDGFYLLVSAEEGLDKTFVKELKRMWNEKKSL